MTLAIMKPQSSHLNETIGQEVISHLNSVKIQKIFKFGCISNILTLFVVKIGFKCKCWFSFGKCSDHEIVSIDTKILQKN